MTVEKEKLPVEKGLFDRAVGKRPNFSTPAVKLQTLEMKGIFPFFHSFFPYDYFF